MNIKDNGNRKSSFALNRSTNPVSILVEVAYMLNPEEYILLRNETFRENVAKSIKKSLEEYILYLKNKKLWYNIFPAEYITWRVLWKFASYK